MKVSLPYSSEIAIRAFHDPGLFVGVLEGQGLCYNGIIANHYKSLIFHGGNMHPLDDYTYIRKNAFEFTEFEIPEDDDFISYVKNCLSQGYYIYIILNERFVKGQRAYQKYDFLHDYMIFGFDVETKEFDTIGYCGFTFRIEQMPYDMIEQGHRSIPATNLINISRIETSLCRVKKDYQDEPIKARALRWHIWHYLHPIIPVWGTAIHDVYMRFLKNNYAKSKKYDEINVHHLRHLYESKYAIGIAL